MPDRTPEDFTPGEVYSGDTMIMDSAKTSKGFDAELLWWGEERIFILHNVSNGEYITGTPDEMRFYMDLLSGEKVSELGLPIGSGPVTPGPVTEEDLI